MTQLPHAVHEWIVNEYREALKPWGSWYVVDTNGNITLFDSEYDAINYCADLGIVEKHGYAKHLAKAV